MVYGGLYGKSDNDVQQENWIDDLVRSNPQGVMKVLSRHGYLGYLAPQDEEELTEVADEFVAEYGEPAILELIQAHPLYDVFMGSVRKTKGFVNFLGGSGEYVTSGKLNYGAILKDALIVIGAVYVIGKVWDSFKK